MPGQPLITRREGFVHLCGLCQALAGSLQDKHLPTDQIFVTFHKLLSLECVECRTKVTGEELFVLSRPTDGNDLTVALRRMRLGFCPNPKCHSYHYTLTLQTSPEMPDWQPHLHKAERRLKELEAARAGRAKTWRTRLVRPALVAATAITLLFVVHQLYFGGRIPFLREPEKFRVDIAPEGSYFH
jgi:hypothetical protein